MTRLTKNTNATYIAGRPGTPGTPGTPGRPGYYEYVPDNPATGVSVENPGGGPGNGNNSTNGIFVCWRQNSTTTVCAFTPNGKPPAGMVAI